MEKRDIIYASSVKGFCSAGTCWQYICDISAHLMLCHAEGKPYGAVDLKHVIVDGNNFVLIEDSGAKGDIQGDIWKLAASAYELMLGTPVFNGLGEASQTKKTPLPSLPGSEVEPLNRLLHSCMNKEKECRPTAATINAIAIEELKRYSGDARKPRPQAVVDNKATVEKYDKSWPEQMVVVLFFLFVSLTSAFQVRGQDIIDNHEEETTLKLLKATLLLRDHNTDNWNEAKHELSKRLGIFTLMDELKDFKHDCALIEKNVKSFGLNRMIKELKAGKRVQNTGKGLLDGSDSRFNYSIYEKGIKKGNTSVYKLSGRSGKQLFIIVPYNPEQQYSTTLGIDGGKTYSPALKDEKGITYYLIDTADGPAVGENLKLEISNNGGNNASFVVINHNYRNR